MGPITCTPTECLWRAIADVRPKQSTDFPAEAAGAFVQVAGQALTPEAFEAKVHARCDADQLVLLALIDLSAVAASEELDEFARDALRSDPAEVAFGTFHTYPRGS